jgi:hypothetical protein
LKHSKLWASGLVAVAAVSSASAQDSTSKVNCLPGDAINPFADAAAANGSEQENSYVVDAQDLIGSWGSTFVVAPIVKAGHTNSSFFTNLMNAQGISRRVLKDKNFVKSSYPVWTGQPGTGVNNDPLVNDAPSSSVNTTGMKGLQFATAFTEFDTTDALQDYHGIVTAIVNADPKNPKRFYVTRIQTAVNSPDGTSENAVIAMGGVDANGNTATRSDANGQTLAGTGLTVISGNNYFLFDALGRNTAIRNVVSNDYAGGGQFDVPATNWVVQNSTVTHNCPTVAPEEVFGTPGVLGSNFNIQFVRGTAFPATADTSHLPAGATNHRGNFSYFSKNFAPLNSTHGLAALLGHNSSGVADRIIIAGLDGAMNVTGTLGLVLPAAVLDNDDGFANLGPGGNQFDHYHSQVAFSGGNGQIAMNLDAQGNLLVAAQVSQPIYGNAMNPENYIAVAKIDPLGNVSWTMAGHCIGLGAGFGSGKPIKDGAGATIIGQMVSAQKFTTSQGPSVSAPMIDGAGNVWFIATIEMFDGSGTAVGLLRSVYEPATFKYELELVARVGSFSQLVGVNSGVNYIISDLRISDSNSVHSGTAWSNNIVESGFMGIDGACFAPSDPRSLGGLIVSAAITYDTSGDGIFQSCNVTDPVPSNDESYRVLLYIGANGTTGVNNYGEGCPGSGGIVPVLTFDGYPASGKQVTLSVTNAVAGQNALLFFGLVPASINLPGPCSLLVTPLLPLQITLPLFGAPGPGNGSISFPATIPAVPAGVTVTMQALCTDPGVFYGYGATNGVQITFQ